MKKGKESLLMIFRDHHIHKLNQTQLSDKYGCSRQNIQYLMKKFENLDWEIYHDIEEYLEKMDESDTPDEDKLQEMVLLLKRARALMENLP